MPFEWSWEHKRLFIKLQVCFSWIWRKKEGRKKTAIASRCNYEDIQQKNTQFCFSNLPVWNMHDNVLLNKDLPCSKRLWHFTYAQTIGYFQIFLNVVFASPFCSCIFFASENWLDYLPSPYTATNKWGFKMKTLHSTWCHQSLLINPCDIWWCMSYLHRSIHRWIQIHASQIFFNILWNEGMLFWKNVFIKVK